MHTMYMYTCVPELPAGEKPRNFRDDVFFRVFGLPKRDVMGVLWRVTYSISVVAWLRILG